MTFPRRTHLIHSPPCTTTPQHPHSTSTRHPQFDSHRTTCKPLNFERYHPNYAADPTHFLSLEGQNISRHEGRTDPAVYAPIPELIQHYWQRIELFHWLPDNTLPFATLPYAFIMSLTLPVSLITMSRHGSIVQILLPHNLTGGYVRQLRFFASASPRTRGTSMSRYQCYPQPGPV